MRPLRRVEMSMHKMQAKNKQTNKHNAVLYALLQAHAVYGIYMYAIREKNTGRSRFHSIPCACVRRLSAQQTLEHLKIESMILVRVWRNFYVMAHTQSYTQHVTFRIQAIGNP